VTPRKWRRVTDPFLKRISSSANCFWVIVFSSLLFVIVLFPCFMVLMLHC
jgi:hypothetical protein